MVFEFLPGIDEQASSVDVCAVAEALGGGGHRHAAGFEVEATLPEARSDVIERLRPELRS